MLESLRAILTAITMCVIFVSAIAPGQTATLLRGYVNQTQEQAEAQDLAKTEQASTAKPLTGTVYSGSFPATYEGNWRCVTVVTDSTIESVPNGQQMESEIQFLRSHDGRILAKWNQAGWVESQANVTAWNATEAQIDRTDYYYGEGFNGNWAARSRDRFAQVDRAKMMAQSYVDQYIDGRFMGRYRTKSTLYRQDNQRDVAELPQQ